MSGLQKFRAALGSIAALAIGIGIIVSGNIDTRQQDDRIRRRPLPEMHIVGAPAYAIGAAFCLLGVFAGYSLFRRRE